MTKEEIKARTSIYDVLERYGLRPNKQGFICCPFHGERTPSLKIYPNTNTFHCFGCGASGDIFKFVELMENVTFKSAFETLGGTYGHKPMTDSTIHKIIKPKLERARDNARLDRLNKEYASTCERLRFYEKALEYAPKDSQSYADALKQVPFLEHSLTELAKALEGST